MSAATFGYIGLPDAPICQTCASQQGMQHYAEAQGWILGEVFSESYPCSSREFEAMHAELLRTGVRRVIIPSFEHLSTHPLIQNLRLERLEGGLQVDVLSLDEAHGSDQGG